MFNVESLMFNIDIIDVVLFFQNFRYLDVKVFEIIGNNPFYDFLRSFAVAYELTLRHFETTHVGFYLMCFALFAPSRVSPDRFCSCSALIVYRSVRDSRGEAYAIALHLATNGATQSSCHH